MFSILSPTQLSDVNWNNVALPSSPQLNNHGLTNRNPKRERSLSTTINEVKIGEIVTISNPEHHNVFINTWPRFQDFKCESSPPTKTFSTTEETKYNFTATEFYNTFVKRTQAQCDEERNAKQGSSEWLLVRKLSLTASVFGAAAGSNPYQTPQKLLEEKLYGNFNGNALTAWGNEHEPHARESFVSWFHDYLTARYRAIGRLDKANFELKEDNAIKFEAEPWLAVSPDGILFFEDADGTRKISLVEFKCPTKDNTDPNQSPYSRYQDGLPSYYKDQVQGICGYLNENKYSNIEIQDIWFVVWRPKNTWITHLKADSDYYKKSLKPKLFSWYFQMYLPALTKKYNNNNNDGVLNLDL